MCIEKGQCVLSGPPSWVTASTKRSWSSTVQRRRGLGSVVRTRPESPWTHIGLSWEVIEEGFLVAWNILNNFSLEISLGLCFLFLCVCAAERKAEAQRSVSVGILWGDSRTNARWEIGGDKNKVPFFIFFLTTQTTTQTDYQNYFVIFIFYTIFIFQSLTLPKESLSFFFIKNFIYFILQQL